MKDETAASLGVDLLVHVNEDGCARGVSPAASGSAIHTQVMKTEGLRQALGKWQFDAAFGGARRDEEKSRASFASAKTGMSAFSLESRQISLVAIPNGNS